MNEETQRKFADYFAVTTPIAKDEPREWASMVGGPRCGEAFEVPAGSQRFRSGKTGDKRVHLYLRSDRTSKVGGRACVVFTHSEVWS